MIQPTHIQSLLSQMATTTGNKEINATLPMLLRILDKKGADKYLVQLGKLIIETQSNFKLAQTIGQMSSKAKMAYSFQILLSSQKCWRI